MNHGWYDEMWNPMTGADRSEIRSEIRNHCNRFSGDVRLNLSFADSYEEEEPGYYVLNSPVQSPNSDKHFLIAPFGVAPTFHEYRLETPKSKYITGRTLYVNPYAETFDMPVSWIDRVMQVIYTQRQHNYVLISGDFHEMKEYFESRPAFLLCENLWLGFRVTERTASFLPWLQIKEEKSHFFIDIDEATNETVSMLETYVNAPGSMAHQMEWILVGVKEDDASKNLLMRIAEIADRLSIPVFFDTEGADLPRVLPKAFMRHTLSDKKKAMLWANCARCKAEKAKSMMYRIGWTKGRGCGMTKLGFLCEECFAEYQKHFPFF